MTDRQILYATAFIRALATGMVGVLLGIYLARLHLSPSQIGFVVGAGLVGNAAATLLTTALGDRWGRRRFLIGLTLATAAGGLAVSLVSHPLALGVAALLGMVNGMGRDRGAALVLEQAMLPGTVTDAQRTRAFAWYNVTQDVGHALGGLMAGLPVLLREVQPLSEETSFRLAMGTYSLLVLLPFLLYLALSRHTEAVGGLETRTVLPESRRILWKISSLFALDSLAGGFLTTALLAFFFYAHFGVSEEIVGLLFFAARLANALSHLGAAWLAKRIGLVNTMVFTHIPSSLLLATVPIAPTFPVAAALFLLRESLVEMDVPTRQSYVMAVVRPEERTLASGVTHVVRMAGWAVAPFAAGLFMEGMSLATPVFIGAGMKILYDLLLYAAFRNLKPPEERGAGEKKDG